MTKPLLNGGTLRAEQDFFALLREFERLSPGQPRLGVSNDRSLPRLQIIQAADGSFAPREVMRIVTDDHRLEVLTRYFGFFAPYGPLPIYVTEVAHSGDDRRRNTALQSFVAIVSQRLAVMHYRAWNQLNPITGHDHPSGNNPFNRRLLQITGCTPAQPQYKHLARLRRNWPGAWLPGRGSVKELQRMLRHYFGISLRVMTRQGMWFSEPGPAEQCGKVLGAARLGRRFYDAEYGVRIEVGPLEADQYALYQRGETRLLCLARCCQAFFRHQYAIDITLRIHTTPDMTCRLGEGRVGRSGWLRAGDRDVCQPVFYSTT